MGSINYKTWVFLCRLYFKKNTTGWVGSNSFANAGKYGVIGTGEPILTNPLPWTSGGNVKSQDHIINLKAFKTDVYKSIDSQDLIWTGFEVLGEDLDYFKVGSGNAHFKTADLNTVNGETHEGIFGGDTYICRLALTFPPVVFAIKFISVIDMPLNSFTRFRVV